MARVALAAQRSSRAGTVLTAPVAGDTGDGNTVPNSGKTLIYVKNSGAAPYVVTVHVRKEVEGKNVPEITKTLAAGEEAIFGPYPRNNFGDDLWINSDNVALVYRVIEPGTT